MPVSNNDLLKEIRAMGLRFDTFTEKMSNLDQRLDNNISETNKNNLEIRESMEVLANEMKSEMAAITKRIDAIEIDRCKLEKSTELIVKGIPLADGENLQAIITTISGILNFEDARSIGSIQILKRTPKSDSREIATVKSMPVVVKFTTSNSRRLFHNKYFAFTKTDAIKVSHIGFDGDSRIFINENLTKHNLDLLRRAKKLKKEGKIAAAYSYDGQICVYHQKSDKNFHVLLKVEDLIKFE